MTSQVISLQKKSPVVSLEDHLRSQLRKTEEEVLRNEEITKD